MSNLNESSFQRLSDPIADIAEGFTLSLLKKLKAIATRLASDPDTVINVAAQIRLTEAEWESFIENADDWTDEAMAKAYLRGIQATNAEVPEGMSAGQPFAMAGVLTQASGGGGSISAQARQILDKYPKHHTMYTVFQEQAYEKFRQTKLPVVRDMEGKIRNLIIESSEAAYRQADTYTRRQFSQEIMDRFAKNHIAGIRYADGRTMKLDSYAEMVARSQTGNAAREAAMRRQQEYGLDLVQISQHYPCSNLCIDWQGRVYSISGQSNNYPPLSRATNNGLYHANSYIKDMETYTKNGWKKFSELDGSETILSLNPETHIPEWSGISELHSHESEKMIELKSNSFDLCVTPDHDLYLGFKGKTNGKAVTKYKFEKAEKAIERGWFSQLRCVNWEGETQEMPINGINEADFARLLAWFISDGYVDGNSIRIAKSKEPHVSEMKPTLENIGFYHDGNKFTIYNEEWAEYFKQFGKSYEKFLPQWILNNRPDIISFFLDAYVLGDGHKRTNKYKGHEFESITYFTTSDKLAGQLGEAIIKAGKYPSYNLQKNKGKAVEHHNGTYEGNHDVWRISANTIKESYYLNSPSNKHKGISAEEINYNDTAYCVTLEKNHIMWVRRNGKTTWSGNCKHSQAAYIPGTSKLPEQKLTKTENKRQYAAQKTQRYNERQIRAWKRREAAAITDDARNKAKRKIRQWQGRQRELLDDNSYLRRKYSREQI